MARQIRIATRRSRLALWQAEHVAARLAACHPGLVVSLVPIVTEGDRIQDRSLAASGGKGLFIKELEGALQDGRADIAVHSMKDMPAALPAGFRDRRRTRARRCARRLRVAAPRIARGAARGRAHRHFEPAAPKPAAPPPSGPRDRRAARQCRHAPRQARCRRLRRDRARGGGARAPRSRVAHPRAPGAATRCCRRSARASSASNAWRTGRTSSRCCARSNTVRRAACLDAERAFAARLGASCQSPDCRACDARRRVAAARGLVGSPDGSAIFTDAISGAVRDADRARSASSRTGCWPRAPRKLL